MTIKLLGVAWIAAVILVGELVSPSGELVLLGVVLVPMMVWILLEQ